MSRKKKIGFFVVAILVFAGILDGIRYAKADTEIKLKVESQSSFPAASAKEIILVYNAWGGIYPGIVDFINKEFFPKSYPCNLCYQTFGTFSMKKEWKQYVSSLPYKKIELHKDDFQRRYKNDNLELPVILIGDGNKIDVLLNASEINQVLSLDELVKAVDSKLKL